MTTTTPEPAAMMGRLGSHLAISLGIAMAIAGATTLLHRVDGGVGEAKVAAMAGVAPSTASDGKFIDRLSFAAAEDRLADRPYTPATLIMPMVVNWPEASALPAPVPPSTKLRSAAIEIVPLPPRRDRSLDDRQITTAALPAPLLLTVEAPRPGETKGEGGWTRIVTTPAVKAAELVSGTASMAQAAGSWTLSQASGLLPRW